MAASPVTKTLTNSELISAKVPAVTLDLRRQAVFLSVVVLAAALRIYAISLYPLAGDEYGSLAEAKAVGLNWNSIIYSSLMHFWIKLGSGELWLRLPAAVFGVATVGVLFKLGEKLGGWRTGIAAGVLAATSPFSIYHSQEVRFYSLFMLAAAAFMLATVTYLSEQPAARRRTAMMLTGTVLLLSHFFGVLALYAQLAAMAFAKNSRWSWRKRALIIFGLPVAAGGLLLTPFVRHGLWNLYRTYGNAPSSVEPVMTPVTIMSLAKTVFAGFVFVFGYHVYPLRWVLVIAGLVLSGVFLVAGARRLWKESAWKVLPFAYCFVFLGVYIVLDAVGGRVAAGVSPRHVAFVWPVLLLLIALGITSFKRPVLYVLLAAALTVNAASIWSGWQKDWTYGVTTDYRSAAEQASGWIQKDTALMHDGRSADTVKFYYPQTIPILNSWPYLQNPDLRKQLNYQRLIFVTNDWEASRRQGFDHLVSRLNEKYSVIDGAVDYPLFEYALDRKAASAPAGYALRAGTNQVLQPMSFYGLEFQDLRLPVSVKVNDVPLSVIGAYGLPDSEGSKELTLPLSTAVNARQVVLLTNIVGGSQSDQPVAEILVESKSGKTLTLPLRLGIETAAWNRQCEGAAACRTVFQWRKRMAIVGQNAYDGALRDFAAGLHGVALNFPEPQEVSRLTIRYTANTGRFYVWGVALPGN